MTYSLTTVGGKAKTYDTDLYYVKLIDKDRNYHLVKGYGIKSISSEIQSLNIDGLQHVFPFLSGSEVQRNPGPIDILIGMEYAKLQPWKIKAVNNLVLYHSLFGTGKVIGGWSRIAVVEAISILTLT